jgi:hypothetical protein
MILSWRGVYFLVDSCTAFQCRPEMRTGAHIVSKSSADCDLVWIVSIRALQCLPPLLIGTKRTSVGRYIVSLKGNDPFLFLDRRFLFCRRSRYLVWWVVVE